MTDSIKKPRRKKSSEPPVETPASVTPPQTIAQNDAGIIPDILYLLQATVNSAKENPSVNNLNAVVKSLSALKLAAVVPGQKKGRKSKTMIARRVIAYIEKEILNIN